jgi:hypothetical protein
LFGIYFLAQAEPMSASGENNVTLKAQRFAKALCNDTRGIILP